METKNLLRENKVCSKYFYFMFTYKNVVYFLILHGFRKFFVSSHLFVLL